MADSKKPVFAPVPARAMLDDRLKERHLRTLMVIAAHDRMSKNGIGCYASHKRLAGMVGCSYQRFSENTRDLGEWGYLEARPHPLNKRLRVYRVIYTAEDADTMKGVKNDTSPNGEQLPPDSSPDSEVSGPDSSPDSEVSGPDSSPDSEVSGPDSSPDSEVSGPDSSPDDSRNPAENRQKPSVNIFCEAEKKSCGSKERNSFEKAPPNGGADSPSMNEVHRFIRNVETWIGDGGLQGATLPQLEVMADGLRDAATFFVDPTNGVIAENPDGRRWIQIERLLGDVLAEIEERGEAPF